jgi:hypothetical protein
MHWHHTMDNSRTVIHGFRVVTLEILEEDVVNDLYRRLCNKYRVEGAYKRCLDGHEGSGRWIVHTAIVRSERFCMAVVQAPSRVEPCYFAVGRKVAGAEYDAFLDQFGRDLPSPDSLAKWDFELRMQNDPWV